MFAGGYPYICRGRESEVIRKAYSSFTWAKPVSSVIVVNNCTVHDKD